MIVHYEPATGESLAQPHSAGNRAGFDALITPMIEPAYRLAFAMLRQRMPAEDAVQEATFKAWNKFGTFRNERGGFRAWYLTIVANECRSLQRGRWWSVLWLDEVRRPQASDEAAMTASELRQTIGRLSRSDRLILYLFYWLDLPLEEVAAVAGVSTGAARARLYRAVGRLRLELDPEKEQSR
ncbi:MAG TPA: RNA polymerase sigma factor [Candidatus Dormibacteraeota bacterium]